jgi:hypothetical protein
MVTTVPTNDRHALLSTPSSLVVSVLTTDATTCFTTDDEQRLVLLVVVGVVLARFMNPTGAQVRVDVTPGRAESPDSADDAASG